MTQARGALAHPTRMLRVALVLTLLAAPSIASAQTDVLVLSTSEEPRVHGDDLRAWVGAFRRATGATHVRRLLDSDCRPEGDAACAARFTRSSRTQRILLIRVLWMRAGCVPMRDTSGSVRGHRMLRTATLDLLLLDAQGHTLAHATRAAEVVDESERRTAAQALLVPLGLAH